MQRSTPSTPSTSTSLWCRGRSRPSSPDDARRSPSDASSPPPPPLQPPPLVTMFDASASPSATSPCTSASPSASMRSASPPLAASPPQMPAETSSLSISALMRSLEAHATTSPAASPIKRAAETPPCDATSTEHTPLAKTRFAVLVGEFERAPLWLRVLAVLVCAAAVVACVAATVQRHSSSARAPVHAAIRPQANALLELPSATRINVVNSRAQADLASATALATIASSSSSAAAQHALGAALPFNALGAVSSSGAFSDEPAWEKGKPIKAWETDDAIAKFVAASEPRYVAIVGELERVGRRFTRQLLADDGVYLKLVRGKGVGVFAARDFAAGEAIPPRRRFEEMYFDGCPPEVRYFAQCAATAATPPPPPATEDAWPRDGECKIARSFTCTTHTDRFFVHETEVFISSYDWDLLVNHGARGTHNVRTRHFRRSYTAGGVAQRQVAHFETLRPIAAGDEILSNYIDHLDDDDKCDEDESIMECLGGHGDELKIWKPRRIQRNGAYRLYMPNPNAPR